MEDKFDDKKNIRKVIREALGEQVSVNELARIASLKTLDTIKSFFPKMTDGNDWDFSFKVNTDEHEVLKNDTKIGVIYIKTDFKLSNDFKINGEFKSSKTTKLDDDNFLVVIEFKLETNNLNDTALPGNIDSIMSHELNHAFVFIKQHDLKSKSKGIVLNNLNNRLKLILSDEINKNPILTKFINMIYLSNPYETQARIQQTATELLQIDGKDSEDTMDNLLKFNPLRDAKMMIAYKADELNKLNDELVEKFIKTFNKSIEDVGIKKINDKNKFIEYWTFKINSSGRNLARKIFKLVADKHNLNEFVVYGENNDGVFKYVFGECYGNLM